MNDEAHKRHLRIVNLRNTAEQSFLNLGKELYDFKAAKDWEKLGYQSFNAYIADPDVDIAQPVASKLMAIYEAWVLELGYSPVNILPAGYSKLYMVTPYIELEEPKLLLDTASSLGRRDLEAWIEEHFPKPTPELPEGKWSLIYADPPWEYDFSLTDSRKIENQYPTMPAEKIARLGIPGIAADDCVLFLWATSPKLREALYVMEEWGFAYKTCMVWVKDKIGMGYYARQKHELLLIGAQGEPTLPSPENRPDSVFVAPRTEHSRKPEIVYSLLETMYPLAKKIELFARGKRDGWEPWGNETNNYV